MTSKKLREFYEEQTGEPIPQGFHVHHLDFDRSNNDIDNLVAIPAKLHGQYHAVLNYFDDCPPGNGIWNPRIPPNRWCGDEVSKLTLLAEYGNMIQRHVRYRDMQIYHHMQYEVTP
jgi:hypothetical protein